MRANAVSLETSHYDSFPEFRERLELILEASEKTIDSDIFTRVGLRYINAVTFSGEDIATWITPALVGVLSDPAYGDVRECFQRVSRVTAYGGYLFQHGLEQSAAEKRSYILDYDFFREEVSVSEAIDVVDKLHQEEFSMFSKALEKPAKEYLGRFNIRQEGER